MLALRDFPLRRDRPGLGAEKNRRGARGEQRERRPRAARSCETSPSGGCAPTQSGEHFGSAMWKLPSAQPQANPMPPAPTYVAPSDRYLSSASRTMAPTLSASGIAKYSQSKLLARLQSLNLTITRAGVCPSRRRRRGDLRAVRYPRRADHSRRRRETWAGTWQATWPTGMASRGALRGGRAASCGEARFVRFVAG